jgi:hypothetical protein
VRTEIALPPSSRVETVTLATPSSRVTTIADGPSISDAEKLALPTRFPFVSAPLRFAGSPVRFGMFLPALTPWNSTVKTPAEPVTDTASMFGKPAPSRSVSSVPPLTLKRMLSKKPASPASIVPLPLASYENAREKLPSVAFATVSCCFSFRGVRLVGFAESWSTFAAACAPLKVIV